MQNSELNPLSNKELRQNYIYLGLFIMICLLLCTNIALIIVARHQNAKLQQCYQEKKERAAALKSQMMSQIADWQRELSIYPHLEAALEEILLGNVVKTEEMLQYITIEGHTSPIALYFRGMIHHQLGNYSIALEELNLYLAQVPHSAYARWRRSLLLLKENRIAEAILDLQELLEYSPDFPGAAEQLKKLQEK